MAVLAPAPSTADKESADAGAQIIRPNELEGWESLYFGTIAPGLTQAGQVSLSPGGTRTCQSTLTCVGEGHGPAKFGVYGQPNLNYMVTVQNQTSITNADGETLEVTNLHPTHKAGTLNDGYGEFMIGADLTVPAQQPPGAYTGQYTVTVEYQ